MNVLSVDDHETFREGIRSFLDGLGRPVEFFHASSVPEALEFKGPSLDLILLDLHMKQEVQPQGTEGLAVMCNHFRGVRVVVVSGDEDPELVHQCIEIGASGFIPKSASREVLKSAVSLVLANGIYIPPHALSQQEKRFKDKAAAQPDRQQLALLTPRQDQILRMAIRGLSNKQIAREVGLTDHTVKSHLSSVFRVIGARNRTEAVYRAAQLGLKLDEPARAGEGCAP